jgi:hypothetical protein
VNVAFLRILGAGPLGIWKQELPTIGTRAMGTKTKVAVLALFVALVIGIVVWDRVWQKDKDLRDPKRVSDTGATQQEDPFVASNPLPIDMTPPSTEPMDTSDNSTVGLSARSIEPASPASPLNVPPSDNIYKVRKGESLWSIAESEYGSGTYWRLIYKANRKLLKGAPQRLLPGMVLKIPKKPEDPEQADTIAKEHESTELKENPVPLSRIRRSPYLPH